MKILHNKLQFLIQQVLLLQHRNLGQDKLRNLRRSEESFKKKRCNEEYKILQSFRKESVEILTLMNDFNDNYYLKKDVENLLEHYATNKGHN